MKRKLPKNICKAVPTVSFINDSDTGIYQKYGGGISIVVGGYSKPKNYKKVHVARRRLAKQYRRNSVNNLTEATAIAKLHNYTMIRRIEE